MNDAPRKAPYTALTEAIVEGIAPVLKEYVDRRLGELALRVDLVEALAGQLKYCGVWSGSRQYRKGNFITHNGAMWNAQLDSIGARPGDGDCWQLCVKSGQIR
jgi:hypothetical protein